MPTIVFNGNADRTFHSRNGSSIADAAIADAQAVRDAPLIARRTKATPGGRQVTRVKSVDQHGGALVEH